MRGADCSLTSPRNVKTKSHKMRSGASGVQLSPPLREPGAARGSVSASKCAEPSLRIDGSTKAAFKGMAQHRPGNAECRHDYVNKTPHHKSSTLSPAPRAPSNHCYDHEQQHQRYTDANCLKQRPASADAAGNLFQCASTAPNCSYATLANKNRHFPPSAPPFRATQKFLSNGIFIGIAQQLVGGDAVLHHRR